MKVPATRVEPSAARLRTSWVPSSSTAMATGASLEARYREGLDETWQVGVQGRFRVSSRGRRVLGACGDLNGYGVRRELEDVRAVLELRPHRRGPRGVDNEAVADGAALYRQLPGEDRRARTRPCRRLAGDPFEPNRLRADRPGHDCRDRDPAGLVDGHLDGGGASAHSDELAGLPVVDLDELDVQAGHDLWVGVFEWVVGEREGRRRPEVGPQLREHLPEGVPLLIGLQRDPVGTVALVDRGSPETDLVTARRTTSVFAGFRFPPEVISLAVRWYLRYGLSYRDVEELLAERGITADHVSVYRWVQRFTLEFIEAARPCRHAPGDRWFADETYLNVAGTWTYLYRAVDQHGQVIDVMLSTRRDLAAARRFFTRALRAGTVPAEVTTDRAPAYPRVLDELVPSALHTVEQYANKPDRGRPRAAESPATPYAGPEAPPLSADPGCRSCLRAKPPPRSLRHRHRSS